ncbi:MAG: hypothetical protein ACRDY7_05780, partial [Acidimicrobiia bacterium]
PACSLMKRDSLLTRWGGDGSRRQRGDDGASLAPADDGDPATPRARVHGSDGVHDMFRAHLHVAEPTLVDLDGAVRPAFRLEGQRVVEAVLLSR